MLYNATRMQPPKIPYPHMPSLMPHPHTHPHMPSLMPSHISFPLLRELGGLQRDAAVDLQNGGVELDDLLAVFLDEVCGDFRRSAAGDIVFEL